MPCYQEVRTHGRNGREIPMRERCSLPQYCVGLVHRFVLLADVEIPRLRSCSVTYGERLSRGSVRPDGAERHLWCAEIASGNNWCLGH